MQTLLILLVAVSAATAVAASLAAAITASFAAVAAAPLGQRGSPDAAAVAASGVPEPQRGPGPGAARCGSPEGGDGGATGCRSQQDWLEVTRRLGSADSDGAGDMRAEDWWRAAGRSSSQNRVH